MITYSFLREIQKKETESAGLTKLSDSFYEEVSAFLKAKKEEAISSQSLLAIKEYENIKKLVKIIQLKREEKLVLLALRNQSFDSLPRIEAELLTELSRIVTSYRKELLDAWSSETSEPKPVKKIKIVKDVEQYKGLDNSVYGPFKPGEEATLPTPEAEWLLKSQLAELV